MKITILAAFTVLALSFSAAYAQPQLRQPAPSLQTFDAGWCNG